MPEIVYMASCGLVAGFYAIWAMMGWNLGPDVIPVYGDMEDYFVPLWHSFRETLLSGRMPWWNELQDLGFPLAANPQASPFHLPNYLLLFPGASGIRLHMGATAFVHATGMFLLMRSRYPLGSACFIAVGTSVSGFLLALHSMTTVLWTFAWIPWVAWGILSLGRSRLAITMLAVALAQSFLAGAWDVWIGIVPLVLALHARTIIRHLKASCGAGVIAFALVLPQLAITIPYLDRTHRKAEGILRSFHWSAGWHDILGYISPNAMLSAFGTRAWELVLGDRVGWVLVAWPGLVCLAILPVFIFFLAKKKKLLLVLMVIQIAVAFAGSIPGFKEFCAASGLRVPVRYPDKLLLGILWIQIFVTWYSLPHWIRWMRRVDLVKIVAICFVWISSWPLLGVISRGRILEMHTPLMWKDHFDYVAAVDLYVMVSNRDIFWVVGSALLIQTMIVASRWRMKVVLLVFSLTAIVDPFLASTSIGQGRPLRDPGAWQKAAMGNIFSPGRIWREPKEPKFVYHKSMPDSLGCDSISGRLVADLHSSLEIGYEQGWTWVHGFNVLAPFYSRTLSRLAYIQPPHVTKEALYRVSAQYVTGYVSALVEYGGIFDSCIVDQSPFGMCRLKDVRPKFHVVMNAIHYPTDSALVQNMIDLTPDRNAVYLKVPGQPVSRRNVVGVLPKILRIDDSLSGERRVQLAPVPNPVWMTMATSWDPGWIAWVDGREVDVLRADYAICGIALPAGAREVIFKYKPKGLYLSFFGAFALLLLALVMIHSKASCLLFDRISIVLLPRIPKSL